MTRARSSPPTSSSCRPSPSLFVLVILGHDGRRVVRVAVTDHPTAAWTAQQLRNAFSENEAPRYLLHDRDSIFADVASTIAGMNIQTVRTAPRSPWQNAYAEPVIGSIRRECLDHVTVVHAAGLHRSLTAYISYYMQSRTHLALEKDAPISPGHAVVGRAVKRQLPSCARMSSAWHAGASNPNSQRLRSIIEEDAYYGVD
jgi:hypothetical protein